MKFHLISPKYFPTDPSSTGTFFLIANGGPLSKVQCLAQGQICLVEVIIVYQRTLGPCSMVIYCFVKRTIKLPISIHRPPELVSPVPFTPVSNHVLGVTKSSSSLRTQQSGPRQRETSFLIGYTASPRLAGAG